MSARNAYQNRPHHSATGHCYPILFERKRATGSNKVKVFIIAGAKKTRRRKRREGKKTFHAVCDCVSQFNEIWHKRAVDR